MLKLSGEYWSMTSVPLSRGNRSLINCAPRTAMAFDNFLLRDFPEHDARRCAGEVELYRMDDRPLFAPMSDLDGAFDQILARLHEHLQPDVVRRVAFLDEQTVEGEFEACSTADGKPTSISLKPIFTSVWNNSNFCEMFIGTASAWLPSRKSTSAPARRARERARRPLAVSQFRRVLKRTIFFRRIFLHGSLLSDYCRPAMKLKTKKPTAVSAVG